MRRKKERTIIHPIMAYVILIIFTIVLSGLLGLLGLSASYHSINQVTGVMSSKTFTVTSLLNLSGLKLIFRSGASSFASFAPLTTLIICLIGIGIMDKSGFLQSFFTLVTKRAKKNSVTFVLALIITLTSISGDISFIVFIPIIALFFKYSKRNPKAGIIMAFAGLTCGSSINIFMNSVESSLLSYTTLAANSLDTAYTIGTMSYMFIMIIMTILAAFAISTITEKVIIPKLEKPEEEEEEFYLDKSKKRGLLFALAIGTLYILIFIYNIIPGLPLSGNLLDNTQTYYIDKLFGYDSFFNQGFVFVITLFFFVCGLFYGIGARTIKNNRDVSTYLGHSLDDIGKTLVLIFFASLFIAIFKETNIGNTVVAVLGNFIANSKFTGIPLILLTLMCSALATILVPSAVTSWSILSSVIVPVFMNAGMTAEFAELVFRAGQGITYGLTPLMAYFVIYLAFLDKYSESDKPTSFLGAIKNILPFSLVIMVIWITLLILAFILGLPIGIGTSAVL